MYLLTFISIHKKPYMEMCLGKNVTKFWKITHMGVPETIRIFEFSMALLIAETTLKIFLNSTCNFKY